MHPKKIVKIREGTHEYAFHIDLAAKQVDLITRTIFPHEVDTIIGMNLVPDMVQIMFYRNLRKLNNEYNAK